MPFIAMERRKEPDTNICGDRCYLHYRAFMDMWNKEPRWTTIDTYARRIWEDDNVRAAALALLVFMHKEGFKYEDEKCLKNGDIL